jgi:hypothetical protein
MQKAASAAMAARDESMHASFHPERLKLALSAGFFEVITGKGPVCPNILLSCSAQF